MFRNVLNSAQFVSSFAHILLWLLIMDSFASGNDLLFH